MSHSPSFSRRFLLRGVVGGGAAIAVAGLLPIADAFAQTAGDARTITSSGVRLRSGAGTSFSTLATLSNGTAVTVVTSGTTAANGYNWVNIKVTSSGTVGWVASDFISSGGGSNPTWPAGLDVFVNSSAVNVRATANGTIIKTVGYGTGGTTTGGYQTVGGNNWVSVKLDSGESGWIAVQFVSKGNGPGTGTTWPVGTAVQVIQSSLNLRNGASLSSAVLGQYPLNTNAEVLGGPTVADGYSWYRVKIYSNGAIGWFVSAGLAKGSASPTTDRIRVVDGPVNLRSEPGTSKPVVAVLATGEGGDLWSTSSPNVNGYNWIKIRVDSSQKIGWVATNFINYV